MGEIKKKKHEGLSTDIDIEIASPKARAVLVGLLVLVILTFTVYQVYMVKGGQSKLKTQTAIFQTVSRGVSANGFVIREERYVHNQFTGTVVPAVSNGSKVAINDTVARIFPSDSAASAAARIDELDATIDFYRSVSAASTGVQPTDLELYKQNAVDALLALSNAVSANELNRFGELTGELRAAITKKQIAYGGSVDVSDQLTALTADANAKAVEGENSAKIAIANSDAQRREKEAEAARVAVAAEKVQAAKALEEAYKSERDAEIARADREKATRQANVVVPAQIEKEKAIIDAEAQAEKVRRLAKGEADAIFAKMDAQARGILEILSKQAEGFGQLVNSAAGDPQKAVLMLIADKLPDLVKTPVEAVEGIKIDKVTVWDNGSGAADGKTATSNFISGMMKSVPPLEDLFKMAGMELPAYLKGAEVKEAKPAPKKDK